MNNFELPDNRVGNVGDEQPLDIPDVPELSDEQLADYQQVFEKSGWDKFKTFLQAENKWGRRAKIVKDIALTFIPYGRTISNASEMATEIIDDNNTSNMDFADKLKKVRNWISWNDKDGDFSFRELGLSLLKIAVVAGVVYGLQAIGVWEAVSNLL